MPVRTYMIPDGWEIKKGHTDEETSNLDLRWEIIPKKGYKPWVT